MLVDMIMNRKLHWHKETVMQNKLPKRRKILIKAIQTNQVIKLKITKLRIILVMSTNLTTIIKVFTTNVNVYAIVIVPYHCHSFI